MKIWHVAWDFGILAVFLAIFLWSISEPLNIARLVTITLSMAGAYMTTKTIRLKLERRQKALDKLK